MHQVSIGQNISIFQKAIAQNYFEELLAKFFERQEVVSLHEKGKFDSITHDASGSIHHRSLLISVKICK